MPKNWAKMLSTPPKSYGKTSEMCFLNAFANLSLFPKNLSIPTSDPNHGVTGPVLPNLRILSIPRSIDCEAVVSGRYHIATYGAFAILPLARLENNEVEVEYYGSNSRCFWHWIEIIGPENALELSTSESKPHRGVDPYVFTFVTNPVVPIGLTFTHNLPKVVALDPLPHWDCEPRVPKAAST
ncbi:hypothetical protein DFP72DRAFT_1053834 [Ephemerocybe angulata]|uniref:Uncharacterized protein n=1 Tax=Ephemerocybe angulata TaxID=980116 RepID=A0A8H6H8X8_9AGAR|nr:hypothetical protein DFP72DRAFT_1053834 [Tulosesus angulatus]